MRWVLEPLAPTSEGLFNGPQDPGLLGHVQPPMSYQPPPQEGYRPPQQGTTLGSMVGPAYQAATANVFGGGPSLFEQEAARRAAAGGDMQRYMDDPRGVNIAASLDFTSPIKAWHASPHLFPEFSMKKIGTGEGGAAFGQGIYTGENIEVPQTYYRGFERDLRKGIKDRPEGGPYMYELTHAADPPDFLHLDRTFKEQSQQVKDKLAPFVEYWNKRGALNVGRSRGDLNDLTGEELYRYIGSEQAVNAREAMRKQGQEPTSAHYGFEFSDAQASQHLKDLGVPGLRYLDQGSRTLAGGELLAVRGGPGGWYAEMKDTKDRVRTGPVFQSKEEAQAWADQRIAGSHNMVFFDPKHVEINKINDQPPSSYFPGLLGP